MEADEKGGPNIVEAPMFLVQHCRTRKRFEEEEVYCTRLRDFTGPEREAAKSLFRGMRLQQSGFHSMDVEHFHL